MILGLIPSRLNSTRLKEKPLLVVDGLPIIIHTLKRAQLSKKLDTSDEWILARTGIQERRMVQNGEATVAMSTNIHE